VFTLSRALWQDEAGFIVSAELVMLGTVLVVGLIAGMACIQDAVIGEYTEVAGALRGLDQSYSASGMHGCWNPCCGFTSWTAGSAYYQHGMEREVCFGLCPPGPIVCPPVVPQLVVPETVPVPDGVTAPVPCPCDSVHPVVPVPEGVPGPAPCPCDPAVAPGPDPCPCEPVLSAVPIPEGIHVPPPIATVPSTVPLPDGVVVPPPETALPDVPRIDTAVGPRKCSCKKEDCPPDDSGECPQPTVISLPGPFVW
jgi:hypothetical protein